MSRIHIARDRQPLGQFTPEEAAEGLKSGRFLPTDLAWREGMSTWEPLSTLTDLPAAPEPPHLEETVPSLAPGIEVLGDTASLPTPPWEEEKPLFSRLLETIQKVLVSPAEAFANVPTDGSVLRAIWFMILIGWPCGIVSIVYQFAAEMVSAGGESSVEEAGPVLTGAIFGAVAVFLPLLLVVGSFVSAAIFHGVLLMLGAASRSYWTTFRVITYVNGATMVLLLMPVCGSLAQSFWAVFSLAVGLKTAHQTTWVNAIVTLLLPTVICCGIIVAIVSLGYSQLMQ